MTRSIVRMGARASLSLWLVLAIAVGALLALQVALSTTDRELLLVTSGSMAPTFDVGDAVVVDRSVEGVEIGDVVMFRAPGSTTLVAHRVVSSHVIEGRTHLRTRGDHNRQADPDLVPPEALSGRVAMRVALLGRVLRCYMLPGVRFVVVALLALPVAILELGTLLPRARAARRGSRSRRWTGARVPLLGRLVRAVIAVGVLMLPGIGLLLAVHTDSVSVPGNALAADILEAPADLQAGAIDLVQIDLNWTATADAYASGYRVYRATAAGGPYAPIAAIVPRTATTYSDNPGVGPYWYRVRAYAGSWESADSNTINCVAVALVFVCG